MEALIVFLPLIGALVAGFAGRAIGGHNGDLFAQIVSSGLLVIAALMSWLSSSRSASWRTARRIRLIRSS